MQAKNKVPALLNPVRHSNTRIARRKIFGIARDAKHWVDLRGRPNHCIGQLDSVLSAQLDGSLCYAITEDDNFEPIEKRSRAGFRTGTCPCKHFDPGHDADGFAGMPREFMAARGRLVSAPMRASSFS